MITRDQIIQHVLFMKLTDPDYARWSLAQYHAAMPWLDLNNGVRAAMGEP